MNRADREMLELAAKAAGWTVVRWTDDDTALLLEGIQQPFNALHENPHSDCMGDALRLAVELGMRIDLTPWYGTMQFSVMVTYKKIKVHTAFRNGDHRLLRIATCRAIVSAAAEAAEAGGAV